MTRRFNAALAAFLMLLVLAPLGQASAGVALDAERRAALAALPLLQGEPLAADALEGEIVVVTFFASWCPPCHAEFVALNRIEEAYRGKGVRILALNAYEHYIKDDGARLEAFLEAKAPRFEILGAGDSVTALFDDVKRIPTLFVFGRDGAPLLHFIHAQGAVKTHVTFEEVADAIERGL
ncbi:MAG: TlpA family protein disulfide reductase [Kiloniellales bacterium]|nr:TlpA family protein disulfide reductase [Kiloniellales bacterium]